MEDSFKNYEAPLKEFFETVGSLGHIGLSSLFLPHTMEGYTASKKKYFYVGQDTYGWMDYSQMLALFLKGKYRDYYSEVNNAWLSPDSILANASQNKTGSFWNLVIKLHLELSGLPHSSTSGISSEQRDALTTLGWSNLHSVEVPTTLKKLDIWNSLDKEKYWKIKEASRKLDHLQFIIDSFDPEYIFIFTWDSSKEEDAFYGLTPLWNENEYIDGVISTYNFVGYKTKVIWCPHPNNFRYKSLNSAKIISEIVKRL